MNNFYLTCAIDYANGDPHVGHAFEKIGADAIVRYRRLRGDDARFAIGMDEHGQNVMREAAERAVDPQTWVDEIAGRWQGVWNRLDISNTDFVRTTAPAHALAVQDLIDRKSVV